MLSLIRGWHLGAATHGHTGAGSGREHRVFPNVDVRANGLFTVMRCPLNKVL